MKPDRIPLYADHPDGAIRANRVGSFVHGGLTFDLISPGYDTQGNRRPNWYQIVHGDVPIFDHKYPNSTIDIVIDRFEALWEKTFGADLSILPRALEMTKQARRACFRDGRTAMSPAQSITRDGRGEGEVYPR